MCCLLLLLGKRHKSKLLPRDFAYKLETILRLYRGLHTESLVLARPRLSHCMSGTHYCRVWCTEYIPFTGPEWDLAWYYYSRARNPVAVSLQYYLVATTSTDLKKSTLAKLYTLVCIRTGKSLSRAESQASTEAPYGVREKWLEERRPQTSMGSTVSVISVSRKSYRRATCGDEAWQVPISLGLVSRISRGLREKK